MTVVARTLVDEGMMIQRWVLPPLLQAVLKGVWRYFLCCMISANVVLNVGLNAPGIADLAKQHCVDEFNAIASCTRGEEGGANLAVAALTLPFSLFLSHFVRR